MTRVMPNLFRHLKTQASLTLPPRPFTGEGVGGEGFLHCTVTSSSLYFHAVNNRTEFPLREKRMKRTLMVFAFMLSTILSVHAQSKSGTTYTAPSPDAPVPASINQNLNGPVFRDISAASGIFHNGHGKITQMVDVNKDGLLDVYLGVVYGRNKIFLNEGNLKFHEITESFGIDCPWDTHGVAAADFNNDNNIDLFVANNPEDLTMLRGTNINQQNMFYIGNDEGFIESAEKLGLNGKTMNYSCGVTTADLNGDGLLDLFVAKGAYRNGPDCANSLFINSRDGSWRDIAKEAGLADEGGSYCCAFCDYDNDGDADLFVGNLDEGGTGAQHLYRNDGNLKFTDVTGLLGGPGKGYTVSCLWVDIDNDGFQDLFLANSSGEGPETIDPKYSKNMLFHNNGDGTFTDISKASGVDIATNSRGATFGDIDQDGDLDIYVTNGRYESLIFINDGHGKFTESHTKTGGSVYYGHGCALGDLDGDGDLDLVVGSWRRPMMKNPGYWKTFENLTNNKNYILLDLQGTYSNRSAVMSKVALYDAGNPKVKSALRGYREVTAGNGTFTGNPLQVHFGADAAKKYDIVVTFPSGKETVLQGIAPGQKLKVIEPK
jgi:enediyne biosynthesis protein E4